MSAETHQQTNHKMRLVRITKYCPQLIKALSKVIIFLLKKSWIHLVILSSISLIIYSIFGLFISILIWIFGSIYIIYNICDWFLYHPNDPEDSRINIASPASFKLPFESVFISAQDNVKINVVFIKQQPENVFCTAINLIYLHGNAGNIGHRLNNIHEIYNKIGCNILVVEYRGYGRSQGYPSEKGLYLDAQAALSYLLHHPGIDHHKIFLFGRSLGAAVAIELAHRIESSPHLRGMIIENTFTSIPDLAKLIFDCRLIRCLPNWFYKNQYNSLPKITRCSLPTLFISGLSDELIPPLMMQTLFRFSSSEQKYLHTFESGTHNFTWRCKDYYHILDNFFKQILQSSTEKTCSIEEQFHHRRSIDDQNNANECTIENVDIHVV